MATIKGSFIKGAPVEGAVAYRLSENLGNKIIAHHFVHDGYINSTGQVVYAQEKHYTDILAIDNLRDSKYGYCVKRFDTSYNNYPKILLFSGDTLETFIKGFTVSEIGNKDTLTAAEIRAIASTVGGATHIAFNSDYESDINSLQDVVYAIDGTNDYLELETRPLIKTFENQGMLYGWKPEPMGKGYLKIGEEYVATPVTNQGVNGKTWYFNVEVPLRIETNEGVITQSFRNYIYVNSRDARKLKATGVSIEMQELEEGYDRYIVLETNLGNVRLVKLKPEYTYKTIEIYSDLTDEFDVIYMSGADDKFYHTDFIPLDALTDGLEAEVNGETIHYCVELRGNDDKLYSLSWPILFYEDVSYSAVSGMIANFPNRYLTADEIRTMAKEEEGNRAANYVIFMCEKDRRVDVSVGGIWFPLGDHETLKDGKEHLLAVQAVAPPPDVIVPQLRANTSNNMWEVYHEDAGKWITIGKEPIVPMLRINSTTDIWEISPNGGESWGSLFTAVSYIDGVPSYPKLFIRTDGVTFTWWISFAEDISDVSSWRDLGYTVKYKKLFSDSTPPQLQVNTETNMWEITYGEGYLADSLGIEVKTESSVVDSEYSDTDPDGVVKYTSDVVSYCPTCKVVIYDEVGVDPTIVTYKAFVNGNLVDKTGVIPTGDAVIIDAIRDTEIVFNKPVGTFICQDASHDEILAECRTEGGMSYFTVPNMDICFLLCYPEATGKLVESSFDNTGNGTPEVYVFSKTLPERYKSAGAISIDAVNDITDDNGVHQEAGFDSHYIKYDEIASGTGLLPPHVYCDDNSSQYLRYSFNVEKEGIYSLAAHLRIKDAQLRGATYIINKGTSYEHAFVTTHGWNSDEEAYAVRDLRYHGSYMDGMLVHLHAGVNTIHITNAKEVTKNQHFRNLYLIKVADLCKHTLNANYECTLCNTDLGLTRDEAEALGLKLAKCAILPDYYYISLSFNNGAPRESDGFCRVKASNGNLMSIQKITLAKGQRMPTALSTVTLRGKIGCVNSEVNGGLGKEARIFDATIV